MELQKGVPRLALDILRANPNYQKAKSLSHALDHLEKFSKSHCVFDLLLADPMFDNLPNLPFINQIPSCVISFCKSKEAISDGFYPEFVVSPGDMVVQVAWDSNIVVHSAAYIHEGVTRYSLLATMDGAPWLKWRVFPLTDNQVQTAAKTDVIPNQVVNDGVQVALIRLHDSGKGLEYVSESAAHFHIMGVTVDDITSRSGKQFSGNVLSAMDRQLDAQLKYLKLMA